MKVRSVGWIRSTGTQDDPRRQSSREKVEAWKLLNEDWKGWSGARDKDIESAVRQALVRRGRRA